MTWQSREPATANRSSGHASSSSGGGLDASTVEPGEELDPFAVGTADVSLLSPAAVEYIGAVPSAENAGELKALVAQAAPRANFDPYLSRAAREYLANYEVLGEDPPDAALGFILHGSGAPDSSVARILLHASLSDREALRASISQLAKSLSGPGELFMGMSASPGGTKKPMSVIFAVRREYELAPTRRVVRRGGLWRVQGRLPRGFKNAKGSYLTPKGVLRTIEVEMDTGHFTADVELGNDEGIGWLSIDGDFKEAGPGKLLQLSVNVGDSALQRLSLTLPPSEDDWTDVPSAEEYALKLLNRDRKALGASALEADERLADIARRHSEDMRDAKFFGHMSKTTGLVADRIKAAGYRAATFGENLAKNDGIAEAQAALMWSVGHRRNALSEAYTHVGIGMAYSKEGGGVWYLSQVFAKPVRDIDVIRERERLYERVAEARRERDLEPAPALPSIEDFADHGAELAGTGTPLSEVFDETAEEISRETGKSATLVATTSYDLEVLEVPTALLKERVEAIAVGIYQDPKHPRGRMGVVFVGVLSRE